MSAARPIVLVPACNCMVGQHPFHTAGQKYVDAVRLAGALPLVVPSAQPDDINALLDLADGVLLTGSKSNVHPEHFGEDVHDPALPLDRVRDAWTLPLVVRALARGVPLLAICRGAQEMNVALGGSLYQAVHEVEGHADHRDASGAPPEVAYDLAHAIRIEPEGLLSRILKQHEVRVNSLHGQAVARLADGLRVEARAPDGVIEAFTQPSAPGFNLATQWHPEWQAAHNPVSRALFAAFGDACRSYRAGKAT
jgi:putative glutamine amidotransferase